MTLDQARDLLTQVVTELKPVSRDPRGVLGAALGLRLVRHGAKDLQREFGFEKLSQFIQARCPDLVVRRDAGAMDVLIDFASPGQREDSDGVRALPPRPLMTRGTARERVSPEVWRAVLLGGQQATYVNRQTGEVVGGLPVDARTDEWVQLPLMPQHQQQAVVEAARTVITEVVSDDEIRREVLAALERAKAASSPILHMSNSLGSLSRLWPAWNGIRVSAVFEHVRQETGIDMRQGASPTPSSSVSPGRPTPLQPARQPKAVTQVDSAFLEDLRGALRYAIDRMSLSELLELRVPAEYLVAGRPHGER